jgi:pyruvate/2-oxoglutarate dehydrogenase complex dihydrolipoamide dehydrogenase (E3) component
MTVRSALEPDRSKSSVDPVAIARWEGEGGKAAREEPRLEPSAFVRVENLVVGGGEAGKYVAWELAKQGRPVLVIERALIGGSCPNVACLPSKNVIRSAKVADLVGRAADYGVRTSTPRTDMDGVRKRKRDMVAGMIDIHRKRFAAPGIEFVLGEGRFVAPRTLDLHLAEGGVRRVVAERVFLNLGTHAALPPVPGIAECAPLTHVEALELDRLPPHLIVLGGGYVGVEFAQAFRRFGSRVTVVQRAGRLLPREDPDVSEAIQAIFRDDGIEVVLGAETRECVGTSGERVQLRLQTAQGERTLEGSDLLVATGRAPNTFRVGLENAGVELDARGFVNVDARLRTTAPGVWAMGECAGSPQFTHVSFDDFRVVRDDLAGTPRTTEDRLIPYCVFIDPELGRVGLGEGDAASLGVEVRVARLPMTSVLRARATGETRGFMKALIDTKSDRILGFTMLGAGAGEVIAVVQTAMLASLPFTALRDAILTHPTMAEGLNVLFASVPDRGIERRAE